MCMYNQRQKLRAGERGLSAHPHSFFWRGGKVGAFLAGLAWVRGGSERERMRVSEGDGGREIEESLGWRGV